MRVFTFFLKNYEGTGKLRNFEKNIREVLHILKKKILEKFKIRRNSEEIYFKQFWERYERNLEVFEAT